MGDRQTRSAGDPASPCLDASGMSGKTTASGGVLDKVAAYPAVALVLQGGGALGAYQRSEEHTSELQSLMRISYAVFCLKKKKIKYNNTIYTHSKTDIRKTEQPM